MASSPPPPPPPKSSSPPPPPPNLFPRLPSSTPPAPPIPRDGEAPYPLPPPSWVDKEVPPPPSNEVQIGNNNNNTNNKAPAPSPQQPSPPPLRGGMMYPPPPTMNVSSYNPPAAPDRERAERPIGLMVGISIGVVGGFFIVALILWTFCYVKKKRTKHYRDCESPQKKDNFYDELPQQYMIKERRSSSAAKCFKFPFKIVRSVRGTNSSSSSDSNLDSENSPKARHVLGFPVGNFTYEELAKATNNFSDANLLGEGGFGYVHKGVLRDRTKDVDIAVKQLKEGSRQGDVEFHAEVDTITRVHHRHLVSLVGFCIDGLNRLLVYEFVNNKTLDFHLHGKEAPAIDWPTRLKVAIGSAKGIAYLHEDCNPTIIHRDIKSSNILLDSHFAAKVSDFGFAKEFSSLNHYASHISTRVVGTFGYLAPEYAQTGKASDKSDVFSFGVVLLELITGQPPFLEQQTSEGISLVTWAKPLLRRALKDGDFTALVDPRLQGNYNREEVANMAVCASSCVRNTFWRRPRMSQIVRALEGDVSLADLDEGIRPGQSSVNEFTDYDNATGKDISRFGATFPSKDNVIYSSGDSNN